MRPPSSSSACIKGASLGCSGFTLIELLITLAIAAILLLLTLSLVRSSVQSSRQAQCAANLKNLYTYTLHFAEDNNGYFPPGFGKGDHVIPAFRDNKYWWHPRYLGRYLRSNQGDTSAFTEKEYALLRCPSRFSDGPDSEWQKNEELVTYLMASLSSAEPKPGDFSFRNKQNLSSTLLYAEGRWSTVWKNVAATGEPGSRNTNRRLRRYHGKGINAIFMDGHIEYFTGSDTELKKSLAY